MYFWSSLLPSKSCGYFLCTRLVKVSPVIKNHIEWFSVWPVDGLLNTPDVLLICLPLPSIHSHTSFGYGGSSMVLCGEYVARAPLYLCESWQRWMQLAHMICPHGSWPHGRWTKGTFFPMAIHSKVKICLFQFQDWWVLWREFTKILPIIPHNLIGFIHKEANSIGLSSRWTIKKCAAGRPTIKRDFNKPSVILVSGEWTYIITWMNSKFCKQIGKNPKNIIYSNHLFTQA